MHLNDDGEEVPNYVATFSTDGQLPGPEFESLGFKNYIGNFGAMLSEIGLATYEWLFHQDGEDSDYASDWELLD